MACARDEASQDFIASEERQAWLLKTKNHRVAPLK